MIDRLWERIERRGPDECWPTNGTHTPNGYALFFLAKTDRQPGACQYTNVHRALFFALHGWWPVCVRHTCDHRWCANPGHLLAGTFGDNNRDTAARSPHIPARGERHGHAKLTEEAVREIRSSRESQRVLAQRFGVDQSQISHVRNRKNWSHV